jgi:hypothetical protein
MLCIQSLDLVVFCFVFSGYRSHLNPRAHLVIMSPHNRYCAGLDLNSSLSDSKYHCTNHLLLSWELSLTDKESKE